jgi:hypothetical protein
VRVPRQNLASPSRSASEARVAWLTCCSEVVDAGVAAERVRDDVVDLGGYPRATGTPDLALAMIALEDELTDASP